VGTCRLAELMAPSGLLLLRTMSSGLQCFLSVPHFHRLERSLPEPSLTDKSCSYERHFPDPLSVEPSGIKKLGNLIFFRTVTCKKMMLNGELRHLPVRETMLLASNVLESELCKNACLTQSVVPHQQ